MSNGCGVCGVKNSNMEGKTYYISGSKLIARDLYSMLMLALAADKAELLRAFNSAGQDLSGMTEKDEEETLKSLVILNEKGLDTTNGFDVFKIANSIITTPAEVKAAYNAGKIKFI